MGKTQQQKQDELMNLLRMGSGASSYGPEKYIIDIQNVDNVYSAMRNNGTTVSWTIPTITGFVTTNTEQEITANKTFNNASTTWKVESGAVISGNKVSVNESQILLENFGLIGIHNTTITNSDIKVLSTTGLIGGSETHQSAESFKVKENSDMLISGENSTAYQHNKIELKETPSGTLEPTTTTYTLNIPKKNGTIATTSDIPSLSDYYTKTQCDNTFATQTALQNGLATREVVGACVLKTGDTMTGALSGTTATFSGQVKSNNRNVLDTGDIINNLTSTSTTDALSAKQGKALNDKFGSYLPLSGGTLTDILYVTNIYSNNSNSNHVFGGGQTWSTGATIRVYGKDASSNAGVVELRAYDGTNDTRLVVNPTGTGYLGGNEIMTISDKTPSITYATGFTARYTYRCVKIATGLYYISLGFTTTNALSANTEYGVIENGNLKIDGLTPTYCVLSGICRNKEEGVACFINHNGKVWINPNFAIGAGKEIVISGMIYCS